MTALWESPYPLLIVALCLLVAGAAAWQNGRRKGATILLLLGAAGVPAAWILDDLVQTDAERVAANVETLVADYKAGDAAAVKAAFAANAAEYRALVEPALAVATFDDERLTDVQVEVTGDRATAKFRLNADFKLLKGTLGEARQPTRWSLDYVREGDAWKV